MSTHNAAAWLVDRNVNRGEGDRIAYRCDGHSTTYAELQREVWRVQHALAGLDVRPGERVALVLDDELTLPSWFLGSMRSGVIPVPLSTMLTAADLGEIIADAEAGCIVVSAGYVDRLKDIAERATDLRHAVVAGSTAHDQPSGRAVLHVWAEFNDRSEVPVADTHEDSSAFWLYSSGTTGTPKGVMHRHGSLRATSETYARSVLEIGPEDRCLSVAKLFFAYGLGNSLTFPLAVGASAILNPQRPAPAGVVELIRHEQPTLFFASPGFIASLLDTELPSDAFSSVRTTVTAGEALPARLQQRFQSMFGHPVLDGIGTTEALHIFLSNTKGAERPGTSGRPVPGYDVCLVDDSHRPVEEANTPGYLQVRGPSLATGYWGRPEATQTAFQDGWLATGDVYTRSEDGYWAFLGRNNDMIKAGGIWVSPAEVESVLVEHADVLEAAVVGARNAAGLETTVAFLVPRSGHTIDPAEIDSHCRERMAAFKRPRLTVVVDELPKTVTGKVQRFALRDRLEQCGPDTDSS